MKILYAPWRSKYSGDETNESKQKNTSEDQCVFCKMLIEPANKKNLVLKQFDTSFVIMNKYPYNAGHLLVLPKRHKATLNDLTKKERSELMEVTNTCLEILHKTLKNEGTNVGINLGKAAGAGIPSHLHIHILPRWQGDTSGMPTLAGTKVISFDIEKIYQQLRKAFDT